MGNHDLWDTPEDRKAKADGEELFRTILSLRQYLGEMNSSLFSVEEIRKLILPGFAETEENKKWLIRLKERVDRGIAGVRHTAVNTES